MRHCLNNWLRNSFTIDIRSIATFRIALGVVCLGHLFLIFPDIEAFLTNDGILRVAHGDENFRWSFYTFLENDWWPWFLWSATVFAAVLYTLGLFTKWANFALIILILSIQARNPFILQAGDLLYVNLLVWSLFLPVQSYCSLDSRWSLARSYQNQSHYSIASAGALVQMACVYFFTAVFKHPNESWQEGTSVMYAIQGFVSETNRDVIMDYGTLMTYMSHGVLAFEFIAPILLFSPIFLQTIRSLTLIFLILMHLAFNYFLNIGMFSFDCLAGLTLFLPAFFWNRINAVSLIAPARKVLNCLFSTETVRSDKPYLYPRWQQYVAAFFFAYMMYSNAISVKWIRHPSEKIEQAIKHFGVSQRWDMFLNVAHSADWTYMVGTTYSGRTVDPFNFEEGDRSLTMPEDFREVMGNNLWMKLHERLYLAKNIQQTYLEYWCRKWNERYPYKPLKTVTLVRGTAFLYYPRVPADRQETLHRHLLTIECPKK